MWTCSKVTDKNKNSQVKGCRFHQGNSGNLLISLARISRPL